METKVKSEMQYLIDAVVQQRDSALNQLAQVTASRAALMNEVLRLRAALAEKEPLEDDKQDAAAA